MITAHALKQERKKGRRYPAVELTTRVKRRKGLIGADWIEVPAFDFTHKGVCVDLDFKMEVGQHLTLALDLKMEVGDITIDRVSCEVDHVKAMGNIYRCDVVFKTDSETLLGHLTRIESLMSRSQNLAQRIQKQV